MIKTLLSQLDHRLKHFTRMRNMEMEEGSGDRDQRWKQRTQYLQGRVESLDEAIDIVRKCCTNGCHLPPPPKKEEKET